MNGVGGSAASRVSLCVLCVSVCVCVVSRGTAQQHGKLLCVTFCKPAHLTIIVLL